MSRYIVTASSLNLRARPQIADNIVGTLARGAEVEYLVLGGKQNNRVCVAGYAKARLLGFRVPS